MSNRQVAMAIAAHPDDIEFWMAGTFLLLGARGYELHYMTLANGSCGSVTMDANETAATRTQEAASAAALAGAHYHRPLVDDIEILYEPPIIHRLCAVIRQVDPQVLLLPSPQDYMEDHTTASRVAVTAAFCRNMRNYPTLPPVPPVESDMCLYHAMPHNLQDQLRQPVRPHFFVDIGAVMAKKREMLSCHRSQKEWLDESQGMDNYLSMMENMASRVGELSGRFAHAEGWRMHSHMGFGTEDFDPLGSALREHIIRAKGADEIWPEQ